MERWATPGLLLLLLVCAACVVWALNSQETLLGLQSVRPEFQGQSYRLSLVALGPGQIERQGLAAKEIPAGSWVSEWRDLPPELPAMVRFGFRQGDTRLDQGVWLDPSQGDFPYSLKETHGAWVTLGSRVWPLRLDGWEGLNPEDTARRSRYAVPRSWDFPGWQPTGFDLFEGAAAGAKDQDILLSLHCVGGRPAGARIVTQSGKEWVLGGEAPHPPASSGPQTLRIVFPRSWMASHGAPAKLLPPSDSKDWGTLRSVRLATLRSAWTELFTSPQELGALDDLLTEFRSYAGLVQSGWLPQRVDQEHMVRLADSLRELLEMVPFPRTDVPLQDLWGLERTIHFIEALEELKGYLDPAYERFLGPIRYRVAVAGLRTQIMGDPLYLLEASKRDRDFKRHRIAFRRALGSIYDDWLHLYLIRFGFASSQKSGSALMRYARPVVDYDATLQEHWKAATKLGSPHIHEFGSRESPSALVRMPVLVLGAAVREQKELPLALVLPEGMQYFRKLIDWVETLPDTPEKAADLALARGVLGVTQAKAR